MDVSTVFEIVQFFLQRDFSGRRINLFLNPSNDSFLSSVAIVFHFGAVQHEVKRWETLHAVVTGYLLLLNGVDLGQLNCITFQLLGLLRSASIAAASL